MADDTVQVYGFSIDQKEKPQRCWQLRPQTAIDMHSGVRVQQVVCRSCSRRWYAGDTPMLALAA